MSWASLFERARTADASLDDVRRSLRRHREPGADAGGGDSRTEPNSETAPEPDREDES